MLKKIFFVIIALLTFKSVKAQKPDSVILNMKNTGQAVAIKDSADYLLQVMTPADTATGVKINRIKEFYVNGSLKLIGKAIIYLKSDNKVDIHLIDSCIEFYPDGKLYAIERINKKGSVLLVECRDTMGKVLAEKGNGKWIKLASDMLKKEEEGPIVDSLEEGEWHAFINDTINYVIKYHKGVFVSTTDSTHIFNFVEREPEFPGGPDKFYNL